MSCDKSEGFEALETYLVLFEVEGEEDEGLGDKRLDMLVVVAAASFAISDLSRRRGGIEDSWNFRPLLYSQLASNALPPKIVGLNFDSYEKKDGLYFEISASSSKFW